MFPRRLDLRKRIERKSIFFLGPRRTGKSTLLRETWKDALVIDLLDPAEFRWLASAPERLRDRIRAAPGARPVVIDEIQKLPEILDEVHRSVEENPRLRYVLTGSSARKLRRSGVNLLAGRAGTVALHPIIHPEREARSEGPVPIEKALRWGGLPAVLTSEDPKQDLKDYVGLYLQEEVRAEGLTRSIGAFSRFLDVAASTNGEQVVFGNVASDAQVPARTVREYYQVLEDTLLGSLLPAFRATKRRKAMATAKFYFFDVGVANALLGRWDAPPGTPEFGRALEHMVYCELRAAIDYLGAEARLAYWRSLSQLEVDFVVERPRGRTVAIEVKGGPVSRHDTKGLLALAEDVPRLRKIVVGREPAPRTTEDGVEVMPVQRFLEELWAGRVV